MYIDPAVKEKVELFFDNEQTHMGHALDIRFTRMSADKLEATMPVSENTIQPFGEAGRAGYRHGCAAETGPEHPRMGSSHCG